MRPHLLFTLSVTAAALSGLLFGFDTAVIAGVTGDLVRIYHLSPAGLGGTVSVALWGTLVGAVAAGPLGDRFGGRTMLRTIAMLYLLSAIGCALAASWEMFVAGRFVGGLAIGASSVLAPVYVAEIAPAERRGRLVALFQLCIVTGILLAYLSNGLIGASGVDEAWRWKLGVAAAPSALLLAMLLIMPNSPRWLRTRGREAEARGAAARLGMVLPEPTSVTHEEPLSWRAHRRPLLLAILLAAFNQLSGINAILYYLNDVFAGAGYGAFSADRQAVIIGLVNLAFTGVGMALIDRIGRKPLLIVGAAGMAVALVGAAAVLSGRAGPALLLPALVGFIAAFALSQGAVIWVYLSEIFPQTVRARGAAIGSGAHWLLNALLAFSFPAVAAVSRGAPFLFFAAMMVVQAIVVALLFPETRGRTLERVAAEG